MAVHYRTKAIIFKKQDLSDFDRVFGIFAFDFGRLDLHAKAIRKINSKLKSGIDIFYLSEVEFIRGRSKRMLTDAGVLEKNNNIIQDVQKLKIAFQISEILDKFIKGQQQDKEIWEFLIDVFGKLNNPQLSINNKQLILCYFIWNFFAVLGYKPEISKCAVCKGKLNPYNIYFSNKEGGVICKKCLYADKEAEKINSDVVKILRLILKKDWQVVSKLKIEPASQNLFDIMSNNYYNHILSIFSFK